MTDPFRHHPELRGKIKPAAESFFRDMDLKAIDARVAELGRQGKWRTPSHEREARRRDFLQGRFDDDLWVFAYGSLMWDPAMEFSEVRRARTDGYQRSFCLWDDGGRGSAKQPGLMSAIDVGAGCEGLAFRIESEKIDHETFVLFRREMIAGAYCPIWLPLETALGVVEAIGFVANHAHNRIVPDIPVDEQANMIAQAEGLLGSNFAYLADMHDHLVLLGIEDSYVADLYSRVTKIRSPD